jgi:hypothetical protein
VTTTTIVDLLAVIGTHLATFELAAPWAVRVISGYTRRDIEVQLQCLQPAEVAAALLAWADTLTEVTAAAWRCYDGDSVHLSVSGRLPSGATVRVYDAIPYAAYGPGANLAPGAATSVRPGVLRALATPGQVSA